jgi:hypothetical protein
MRTVENRCEKLAEPEEHLVLRPGIQRRRRLVQNQELRVTHVGPRQRHLLPLATREIHPAVEPLAQHLLVLARQPALQYRPGYDRRRLDRRIAVHQAGDDNSTLHCRP